MAFVLYSGCYDFDHKEGEAAGRLYRLKMLYKINAYNFQISRSYIKMSYESMLAIKNIPVTEAVWVEPSLPSSI